MEIDFFNLIGMVKIAHYLVFTFVFLVYIIYLLMSFSLRKNKKATFAILGAILVACLLFYSLDNCEEEWRKGINGQL
jgi:uncharacterized membrane protein